MAGLYEDGEEVNVVSSQVIYRWDDIVIRIGGGFSLKRVQGIPGDRFAISEFNEVLINDKIIETSDGEPLKLAPNQRVLFTAYHQESHGVIPDKCYLVFGNIQESQDSRSYGLIHQDDIHGKINTVRGES